MKAKIFNKLRANFFSFFLNKRARLFEKESKNQPVRKELVPIFSWKTRKNSTNDSMENKKFAKKNFYHTPNGHQQFTN